MGIAGKIAGQIEQLNLMGAKFKSRMYIDEKHTVFVFLPVFMTMIHSDIDYNGKIMLKLSTFCNFWCRQPDFPIDLRVFQPSVFPSNA